MIFGKKEITSRYKRPEMYIKKVLVLTQNGRALEFFGPTHGGRT